MIKKQLVTHRDCNNEMDNQQILFVYNANSSLFAQLMDYAHKVISPETYQCNLCKLTFGNLGMKREWKEFIQKFPYKVAFLHKDQFMKKYPDFANTTFPAAFVDQNGRTIQLLTSQEITTKNTLKELENMILLKIA